MRRFRVGDLVIYTSGIFGSSLSNPLFKDWGVFGTVIEVERYSDGYYEIWVEWIIPDNLVIEDGGDEDIVYDPELNVWKLVNTYIETDLEIALCELTTSFKR